MLRLREKKTVSLEQSVKVEATNDVGVVGRWSPCPWPKCSTDRNPRARFSTTISLKRTKTSAAQEHSVKVEATNGVEAVGHGSPCPWPKRSTDRNPRAGFSTALWLKA